MAWDFATEPEFQEKLDWADRFVTEEVEPLDLIWPGLEFTPLDETRRKAIDPLKEEVRRQGLCATHLGPALRAQGYRQLKLTLLSFDECKEPLAGHKFTQLNTLTKSLDSAAGKKLIEQAAQTIIDTVAK